jgi:hypothetical protein
VSLDVEDPNGDHIVYDLETDSLVNLIVNAFVSVFGNVEVIVIPDTAGRFVVQLNNVPETARGGVVYLGLDGDPVVVELTDDIRDGTRLFELTF